MKLVNIGYGNVVMAERIVSIIDSSSSPVKKLITESRNNGMLIDATYGRKTRSVIIIDNKAVVLSAIQADTISNRLSNKQ